MIFQNDYQRIALDSDRMMITQCGRDYHDFSNNYYAKIYIKWAVENCPERLHTEADKGSIYIHICDKVQECEAEQWRIWLKMRETDKEYKLALENADTAKVWQLENLLEMQAKEIIVKTCLCI